MLGLGIVNNLCFHHNYWLCLPTVGRFGSQFYDKGGSCGLVYSQISYFPTNKVLTVFFTFLAILFQKVDISKKRETNKNRGFLEKQTFSSDCLHYYYILLLDRGD
jgi:hypothetical protein